MNPVIITLTNGKRVANFSSPHAFEFEDGSILPAVSNEDAEKYKVIFVETDLGNGDIELSFKLSESIKARQADFMLLMETNKVDVVFIPLPMMTALKETLTKHNNLEFLFRYRFRCIRIEDRIKKLVSIHKQCI